MNADEILLVLHPDGRLHSTHDAPALAEGEADRDENNEWSAPTKAHYSAALARLAAGI